MKQTGDVLEMQPNKHIPRSEHDEKSKPAVPWSVSFQELLLGASYYAIEKLNDLGNFNNMHLLTRA